MDSFFTGANLTWIIGIISSIVAGLNALSKFRYERKSQLFKETNANIFKKEKEEVLAAISTLSLFKKDRRFERHTTNVLLSRLYTELDYDITNAIGGALLQYSNRQELLDILSEVLDINRNFFVQTAPIDQRLRDMERVWDDLNASQSEDEKKNHEQGGAGNETDPATKSKQSAGESVYNLENASSKELLETYKEGSLSLILKKRYELLWHKQITADTYSRLLRRAYNARTRGWDRIKQKYYKVIGAKKRYNRFKELDMNFYQNDFNYVFMAFFNTSTCNIIRSAIASSTIVDVGFLNIGRISGSSFEWNTFYNCTFRGGTAEPGTTFENCKFFKGRFEKIYLQQVNFNTITCEEVVFDGGDVRHPSTLKMYQCSFTGASFTNCTFRNCIIESSALITCLFQNVLFENVEFKDTYFCNSNLIRVNFKNCTGLLAQHFYRYYGIDDATQFSSQFFKADIDGLDKIATEKLILASTLSDPDKAYLQGIFNQAPIN